MEEINHVLNEGEFIEFADQEIKEESDEEEGVHDEKELDVELERGNEERFDHQKQLVVEQTIK